MFVAYAGEYEVIVTTAEKEKDMLGLFFASHTKRFRADFERIEYAGDLAVWIQSGGLRAK